MRFRSLSLAIALLATPIAAEAQPFQGLYIGAGAGYNLPQNYSPRGRRAIGAARRSSSGWPASATRWGTGSASNWRVIIVRVISATRRQPLSDQRLRPDLWRHGQRVVRHRCRSAVDLSLHRRRRRLCADPSVAKRHLCACQLPADQRSLRSKPGKLRVPGDRRAGVPDPRCAGPVPHDRIPFLRRTGQRELCRQSGRRGRYRRLCPLPSGRSTSTITASCSACVTPSTWRRRCRRPSPQAAPAPAPARSYLVFFDWDKATLTDRARQVVKEAADNSTRVQYTRIEVNGYTDTSGTHQYNQGCRSAAPRRCRPN